MPVIELARHLGEVEPGGVIAVVADDPAARVDIPAWCRMREQEYVGEDLADDGAPRYLVRRGRPDASRVQRAQVRARRRRPRSAPYVASSRRRKARRDRVYSWVPTCSTT